MVEIERKYIIKLPSLDTLRAQDGYTESSILQIYISSERTVTHRIRRRSFSERVVYTETKKQRIDKMSAIEDEREISENEFLLLEKNIKEGTRPIEKTRCTFLYHGKVFEIDIYPEWKRTCILEIELAFRDERIDFPDFISVLEEVTGDGAYSNSGMARRFPRERLI